jgi:hypothetical protein
MKPSLVPIACGTALALMAGAAASHWHSVREMQALAALLPADLAPAKLRVPAVPDDQLAKEAESFIAEARRTDEKPATAAAPKATASGEDPTGQRIEKLLSLLENTVEENRELRDRIGETSRDLLELRFQVDSYDGQFRPLKVEEEPTLYDDGSAGVLPPLESP